MRRPHEAQPNKNFKIESIKVNCLCIWFYFIPLLKLLFYYFILLFLRLFVERLRHVSFPTEGSIVSSHDTHYTQRPIMTYYLTYEIITWLLTMSPNHQKVA